MGDMRAAAGVAGCLLLASCAVVSGLNQYSTCTDGCGDPDSGESTDASSTLDVSAADDGGDSTQDADLADHPSDNAAGDVDSSPDAPTRMDGSREGSPDSATPPSDGPTDVPSPSDAADASSNCDASSCPVTVSAAVAWSCARGACNGTCSQSSTCACASDSECGSGKCVEATGRNDQSCGAACTGSGPADGFGCELASPGIPATCATTFGYAPSNFAPASLLGHAPAAPTTIGCDLTYDSSSHAFTACSGSCTGNFCSGATAPYIAPGVAQTGGGPNVDILVFSSLTLDAGNTLSIVDSAAGGGGNAVILAVFGNATIAGTIHADGSTGATGGAVNTNSPGASGAGGNSGCTSSSSAGSGLNGGPSCSNPTNDCRDSGGGGGGGSASGGSGAAGVSGAAGSAGAARANGSISPLRGGCPGGTSGGWACTSYGGGAGGAVQISAAGVLSVSGTITANGGAGGSSNCSATFALCGITYGGGGGGGGSGGAILLEGHGVNVTGSTLVNGGAGGASQGGGSGGAGGTSASSTGANGNGANGGVGCSPASGAAGGGGGGYGYLHVNGSEPAAASSCVTSLSPAPVCGPSHTACLCVDDSNCSSGRCINASGQCTATCTGTGAPDISDCQPLLPQPTSYACSTGNCSNVSLPTGTCDAGSLPCYCTSDAQCSSGRCVAWPGCASGACSGSGAFDGFHCAV
jgi:hypothetical protein